MAKRSYKREAKVHVKKINPKYFDAKLRFALFIFVTLSYFYQNNIEQLIGQTFINPEWVKNIHWSVECSAIKRQK